MKRLQRQEHLLALRQGFQRALYNSKEQWEIKSGKKEVLTSLGIRTQTRVTDWMGHSMP
jgi:hypothetical protein